MRRVRFDAQIVTQPLVEPRCSGVVRTKAKPLVDRRGAVLECADKRATYAGTSRRSANEEMTKSSNGRIIDVRIGRNAAEPDQLVGVEGTKEEFARGVERGTLGGKISEKASDELKPLVSSFLGEPLEPRGVLCGKRANEHRLKCMDARSRHTQRVFGHIGRRGKPRQRSPSRAMVTRVTAILFRTTGPPGLRSS